MCCQKRGILWEFSEWGEGVSAIPIAMLDNTAQLRKMAKTFGIPYWGEESAKVGKFSLDSVPKTGWMLFLAEIKI